MNSAELDRLWHSGTRKVVSAEITSEPGALPGGVFDQVPRVMATLDDGRHVELFSFYAHERSFAPEVFVGLTVDQARRLKFAPEYRLSLGPLTPPKANARE